MGAITRIRQWLGLDEAPPVAVLNTGKPGAASDQAAMHSTTGYLPGRSVSINQGNRVQMAHHTDHTVAGAIDANDTPIVRLMRKMPGYIRTDLPYGQDHLMWLTTLRVIRKSVPALDAAILKRRFLEGTLVAESDDQGLQDAINTFIQNVVVGYTPNQPKTGLQIWLDHLGENADEFGEAVGEIRLTENGREIERLVVPDSRSFTYQRLAQGSEDWTLYQRQLNDGGTYMEQPVDSPFVRTMQFTPSPLSPWGRALAGGLEFTSEVFIRLMISMNNLVWRMGDPSKLWKIMYGPEVELDDGSDEMDLDVLRETMEGAYRARNAGDVVDVFYSLQGGTVESDNLGENLLVNSLAPYFKDYMQQMVAQITGKADVPSWLYPAGIVPSEGLGTERAQMEGTVAQVAADQRAALLDARARWVINTWLLLDGSSGAVDRYTLHRERISPVNEKMVQEARAQRATADATFTDNANVLEAMGQLEPADGVAQYLEQRDVI